MIKKFLKFKFIIPALIIITIGGVYYFINQKGSVQNDNFISVKRDDIKQEVSVTGKVKPSEKVDLAFEKSGKINDIKIKVGDIVVKDQILAAQENSDIVAQLSEAYAKIESAKAGLAQESAALESQKAKLDEYLAGTRPEEITLAQTKVLNAQKVVSDALMNLETIQKKADASLREDYDNSLADALKSLSIAEHALYTLTDVQNAHFTGYDEDSNKIADAKSYAVELLLGVNNAGRWVNKKLQELDGGAKGIIQIAQNDPTSENIILVLQKLKDALQKLKIAVDLTRSMSGLTTTEITNLNTESSSLNSEIITLTADQKDIDTQKATNTNDINTAQSKYNDAQNALKVSENELELKKAGYTTEQITAQRFQVKRAEANIASQRAVIKQTQSYAQNIQAQLDKTILKSPINGMVTKQDSRVGEIISANNPFISIISESQYEVETFVPESDIAKVSINQIARITLDAYGSDIFFEAKVISIDPAETILEGVSTYKVILQFTDNDPRVKPGMTANIDVMTGQKNNVIIIPQRAVFTSNGEKMVWILKDDGIKEERTVVTGLKGSNGDIEIIEGLKEGEKILTSFTDK